MVLFVWLHFINILASSSFSEYLKLTLIGVFVGLGIFSPLNTSNICGSITNTFSAAGYLNFFLVLKLLAVHLSLFGMGFSFLQAALLDRFYHLTISGQKH